MSAQPTTWRRSSGFVWSMLGSAIGFANILSFSAQCYKNGGGAFLIPFICAILLLGLPMLLLEGAIGQVMRLPLVSAFGQAAGRVGKTFGWLAIIAVSTIGMFYVVLTGYSIAYTYFSGVGAIPSDTATFFKQTFLRDTESLTKFGSLSWPVLLSTGGVLLFAWAVLARNIRSGIERICTLALPLLTLLMALFALLVAFLPGALDGWRHYLSPDFSKLSDPHLWRDVFGHVFFSFSLGIGIVTGYSRHTGTTTSIPRAMAFVALGDLLVSLIAGFAIFGGVGFLSHTMGIPFNEIVKSDSTFEMGFVIFPKILQQLGPLSPYIGALFFGCIFIAGITGVFSIMESVMGNIQVEFSRSRRAAAAITTAILLAGATLFSFGNGQAIIGSLAPMVLGNNMLLGGLAEIVIFLYLNKKIKGDAIWTTSSLGRGSRLSLQFFAPCILAIILATSIRAEMGGTLALSEFIRWGWLGGALLLSLALSWKRRPSEQLAPAA